MDLNRVILLALLATYVGSMQCQEKSITSELISFISNNKAPLKIVGVSGKMPNNYSIVHTTISIKPEDYEYASKKLGPSPIITRSYLGEIGPNHTAALSEILLEVPGTPVDLLAAAHHVPTLIAKIAGVVNPIAGAAAGAVAGVVEIGLQMASDQLNKALDIQETTVGLLEILPSAYYRINTDTNEIELTPAFKQGLEQYNALHDQAIPSVQSFNNINKQYEGKRLAYYKKYKTYDLLVGNINAQADYHAIMDLYTNQLLPALKDAVSHLKQLEQFSMHRISIMALNTKQGTSCGSGWQGPFQLNIFFFLGAKITNIFSIDFCVQEAQKVQTVLLKISPDILSTNPLRWNKGGIQLIAVDKDYKPCTSNCLIGFQSIRAGEKTILPTSAFYSWWDSMITSSDESATGLTQYLLPFDVYKLEKEVRDKNKITLSTVTAAATEAMGKLSALFGKKETQEQILSTTNEATSLNLGTNNDIMAILDSLTSSSGTTTF